MDRKINKLIDLYIKSEDYKVDLAREKEVNILRQKFLAKFPLASLNELALEDYCLGYENYRDTFCYWIETYLNDLGGIHGSTSTKFGVYYGKNGEDKTDKLRWTKWTEGSFDIIREELLNLVSYGAMMDLDSIHKNHISPMLKGKILYCYYPEKYLDIYSYDHVKQFLKKFGVAEYPVLEKAQQKLIDLKNSDPVMRKWSNWLFASFLYRSFPDVKVKSSEENDEETPVIDAKKIKVISSSVHYEKVKGKEKSSEKENYKPDYEKAERAKRNIGREGENAVVNYEKNYLIKCGKPDLAEKVNWISQKSDAYGYDVVSYDPDSGNEKHIEVKTSLAEKNVDFYLTDYEYMKLCSDPVFCIYYVFNIKSTPKIYLIDNEQLKNRFSELAKPVLYKVQFQTEDLVK